MRRQLASEGIGTHLRSLLHVSSFPCTIYLHNYRYDDYDYVINGIHSWHSVFLKPLLPSSRDENLLVGLEDAVASSCQGTRTWIRTYEWYSSVYRVYIFVRYLCNILRFVSILELMRVLLLLMRVINWKG